jgi:hypothetical protein
MENSMKDWTDDEIINSFNGIIRDAKNMNALDLELKYKSFKEANGKLYDVAIDSVASGRVQEAFNMLQMMLKARNKMKNGSISKLSTDIFVGNELGKKYIYPKTNTPSVEDYKNAIVKIKEKIKENENEDSKNQSLEY